MPVALLAFGGLLKRAGIAALGWLSHRSIAELALIAVTLFAIVQHFELAHSRSQSARWQKQFQSEHTARITERKSYETAQVQAKAKNEAEVHATEERYKRNNDEAVSSLNDRLARLRRELSAGGTAAAQGHPGQPQVSQVDGAAGAPGSPRLCLSPAELLRAAENEERHDQLITLIEKQLLPQPPLPR
jgi:hypothetical protein